MDKEKKYEITISDLDAYIGVAAFEVLPEDATQEDADVYAIVAALIACRLAKHLDGSDPFPAGKLIYAKKLSGFVDELGEACEKILRAAME